jgi:Uncharacterised nucleotidyltransferase
MSEHDAIAALVDTLKLAVSTLREQEIPFMLGGSLATWARGGPEPKNDLDLMVKPQDAQRVLEALAKVGMRPERPPEEWLLKAWNGDVLVDVIFEPSGVEITDEVMERADTISVMAMGTPVMALEDVLVTMLMALDEHSLDYTRLLAIARSLREQIDFPRLRSRTSDSPYARAFFTLVQEVGLAPALGSGSPGAHDRVRVLPGGAA